MDVIGNQRTREATGLGLVKDPSQPVNENVAILVVLEYFESLDPSGDDVMDRTGSAYAGLAEHVGLCVRSALIS